jgi:hypothetical protein
LHKFESDADSPPSIIKLDFIIQLIAPDGSVVKEEPRTFKLSKAELTEAKRKGVNLSFNVAVSRPGYYHVNVAARIFETGLAGNTSRFVEVPAMTKGKLFMSDLLVFDAPASASALESAAFLPEQNDVAWLNRSFSGEGTLKYQYYIYHDASSMEASSGLTVQSKIKRDGKVVAETPPRRMALNTTGQTLVGGEIPLKTFAPGEYTFEVVVSDTLKRYATSSKSSEFAIK